MQEFPVQVKRYTGATEERLRRSLEVSARLIELHGGVAGPQYVRSEYDPLIRRVVWWGEIEYLADVPAEARDLLSAALLAPQDAIHIPIQYEVTR